MNMHTLVDKVESTPKVIFLVDGIGALITFLSLFGIGFFLQKHFGMPKNVLYILSFIVALYAIYSLLCYFLLFKKRSSGLESRKRNWQSFLKVIIVANSLYCVAMLLLLIQFYQTLTVLGLTYFIFEVMIIMILVLLEIKLISK